jgi:outer membrane protein assembly factor BamB
VRKLTFTALLAAVFLGGCGAPDLSGVEDPASIDDLHLQLDGLDTGSWVERFDPERSWGGYTLVMYRRRVPMVIDMEGRVVNVWPLVRVTARARLGTDGRLLVIGIDDLIKEYDWDGRLVWYHRLPADLTPHHDVIWLGNGNVLVLARDEQTPANDHLLEVDRDGRVVWHWVTDDHREAFPSWRSDLADQTHSNSIHELPPNRWFDAGDTRFRPGNILVSGRNMNTIFVVDRRTGEVVWQFSEGLDRQHEALMIPEGQPGAGFIMLLNNGLKNKYVYRRSAVIALNPVTGSEFWRYEDPLFFSSIGSVGQPLANGNVMIGSSRGGRAFEITPDGDIVWQWTPPFFPTRPLRYGWDHCPQLERLGRPVHQAIPSRRGRPHVDQDLHAFGIAGDTRLRVVAGKKRHILREHVRCRELVMPPDAGIDIGHGLDIELLGDRELTARFRYTLRSLDGGPTEVLLDDTVESISGQSWRDHYLPVQAPAYKRVELCIDIETGGAMDSAAARKAAVVENPLVFCGDQPSLPQGFYGGTLTVKEMALRERQLRALGYIE